jgi:short-subunit dehydrogenase
VALEKSIILLTGANGDIGRAVAENLARQGATLFLACRTEQSAQKLCAELQARYPQSQYHPIELAMDSFF